MFTCDVIVVGPSVATDIVLSTTTTGNGVEKLRLLQRSQRRSHGDLLHFIQPHNTRRCDDRTIGTFTPRKFTDHDPTERKIFNTKTPTISLQRSCEYQCSPVTTATRVCINIQLSSINDGGIELKKRNVNK